jgi:hypothetical protein
LIDENRPPAILNSAFSILNFVERYSMRSHLAIALILCGIIALLSSIDLGPQAAVSLAQNQTPPPRPTLTAAPPTPIPPTAPPATATPKPRSHDNDESATPTATPTLTPAVVATPTVEPTATSTPAPPPSPTAAPARLPKTGDGAPARWSMALLGLALLGVGLRLFRAASNRRGRA